MGLVIGTCWDPQMSTTLHIYIWHRLGNWEQNWWFSLCVAIRTVRFVWWGCWWMGRMSWHDCTMHVHKVFLARGGKQMIMTCHLMMSLPLCLCRGLGVYKGKHTQALRLLSGFLAAVHLSYLVRSHQPSVVATSVPLMEWEYIFTGKCYLFVQLHVPKVILGTLS